MKNTLVLFCKLFCLAALMTSSATTRLYAESSQHLGLNSLFTDNMILQREQLVPVWGTALPGTKITVEFARQRVSTITDAHGQWSVALTHLKASEVPRSLCVSSSNGLIQQTLNNVLVGDVWLCGGQSNMAQTMDRYLIWDQVKGDFSNPYLRLFKIKEGGISSADPSKELVIDPFFKNTWQSCTPDFAAKFSAVAGFFGMQLQQDTKVPIGLLYANRGATQANSWLPRELLETNPKYARFLDPSNPNFKESKNNPGAIRTPSHLYNGTIYPLAPFAIKGVIWYQGESDSRWAQLYADLQTDIITSWRALWGYEFPFLVVQLAPHAVVPWDQLGEARAWVRDAQYQSVKAMQNAGLVVITDAGEGQDIHPQAKEIVGHRLATLAASLDDPTIEARCPKFEKMLVKQDRIFLRFTDVGDGLETRRVAMNRAAGFLPGQGPEPAIAEVGTLTGFTICGEDQVFVPALARIISQYTVEVFSPHVSVPVAVRYGWANFPLCNLYNVNGMPASPFRTDAFPMPSFTGSVTTSPSSNIVSDWGSPMQVGNVGDGAYEEVVVDGQSAFKTEGLFLYFVAPEITKPATATIVVQYHDSGYDPIRMLYDSTSDEVYNGNAHGAWKPGLVIQRDGTGRWKTVEIQLPDARFSKACNGADLRLQSTSSFTISDVYLKNQSVLN